MCKWTHWICDVQLTHTSLKSTLHVPNSSVQPQRHAWWEFTYSVLLLLCNLVSRVHSAFEFVIKIEAYFRPHLCQLQTFPPTTHGTFSLDSRCRFRSKDPYPICKSLRHQIKQLSSFPLHVFLFLILLTMSQKSTPMYFDYPSPNPHFGCCSVLFLHLPLISPDNAHDRLYRSFREVTRLISWFSSQVSFLRDTFHKLASCSFLLIQCVCLHFYPFKSHLLSPGWILIAFFSQPPSAMSSQMFPIFSIPLDFALEQCGDHHFEHWLVEYITGVFIFFAFH